MSRPLPIIQFDQAQFRSETGHRRQVDFRLGPGEWLLLHEPEAELLELWIDVAMGLIWPDAGAVRFLGKEWTRRSRDEIRQARGAIACFHDKYDWIAQKPMLESIITPALYHRVGTVESLTQRAEVLCGEFGLPGIPVSTPPTMPVGDRLRSTCVLGLLRRPRLLIIVEDTNPVWDGLLAPLVNRIQRHCFNGGSALWIVTNRQRLDDPRLTPDHRQVILGTHSQPCWPKKFKLTPASLKTLRRKDGRK